MSNSYFQFKQFRVEQDRCGMKVSTDACIQGAWTPVASGAIRVLDIGAGTGLLSLMIAQRNELATIDALEIDVAASEQAKENAANSPFKERIAVHNVDAKAFVAEFGYDLIICNPPFFKDSLLGSEARRNAARHNVYLEQDDLLAILDRLISDDGIASVMWPLAEQERWDRLPTMRNWHKAGSLYIKDKEDRRVSRVIGLYSKRPICQLTETLAIKEPDGNYTDRFRELLSPFYLHIG